MDTRSKILVIPRLLSDTLEKGLPEYEPLVRRVRWGDGPLYLGCCGPTLPVGMAGAYLLEWLAGWPVVVRPATSFEAYTLPALRPRSVVVVVSTSGEDAEAVELVRAARSRGGVILALTRNPEAPLAKACDGVLLTRDEGADDSAAAAICQWAALSRLALIAARLFKSPNAALEPLDDELSRLPAQLEWCFTQLSDALRAVGQDLQEAGQFWVVGGGLYHPVAIRAARRLSASGGVCAKGFEVSDFCSHALPGLRRNDVVVLVSGSRLRVKRVVHQAAAQIKSKGARLISLTDSNDQELSAHSDAAILMPPQTEVSGSILALTLLELMAAQWATGRKAGRRQ